MKDKKLIGSFEKVTFPDFDIGEEIAKIDTGAWSGAFHCTKVYEETNETGKKVLCFSPFDHPKQVISLDDYTSKKVKSSNGHTEKRYFITTSISIRGIVLPIVLSLADRSEMKWTVLIGRRFLQDNKFLVDVSAGTEYGVQEEDKL